MTTEKLLCIIAGSLIGVTVVMASMVLSLQCECAALEYRIKGLESAWRKDHNLTNSQNVFPSVQERP